MEYFFIQPLFEAMFVMEWSVNINEWALTSPGKIHMHWAALQSNYNALSGTPTDDGEMLLDTIQCRV